MNFSEAKSIFEAITRVLKATANLDLHEKIVSLREYIVEIKDIALDLEKLAKLLPTQKAQNGLGMSGTPRYKPRHNRIDKFGEWSRSYL